MNQHDLHQWLFDNGGPVIRYRTATELMQPNKTVNINKLKEELLNSPAVKKWLNNIITPRLLYNNPPFTPHV